MMPRSVKISEDIKFWRTREPGEQVMDNFIKAVKELEKEHYEAVKWLKATILYLDAKNLPVPDGMRKLIK